MTTPKYKAGDKLKYLRGATVFCVTVITVDPAKTPQYNVVEDEYKTPFNAPEYELHDNEASLNAQINNSIEHLKWLRAKHCPSLYPEGHQL